MDIKELPEQIDTSTYSTITLISVCNVYPYDRFLEKIFCCFLCSAFLGDGFYMKVFNGRGPVSLARCSVVVS